MRKIILALLLIFFISSFASATDFSEIATDDSYSIYVDWDSFQYSNKEDYYTFRTKWIPRGKVVQVYKNFYKKTVSHQITIDAYKPGAPQIQELEVYTFFNDGSHIKNMARNYTTNGWKKIIYGSYAHYIWWGVINAN